MTTTDQPTTTINDQACEGCGALPAHEHADDCPVFLANMRASWDAERGTAPNVIVALSRVMAELPGIGRDMVSPQGYNYRGIEQITLHAQPLFARHGVVLAPYTIAWQEVTNLVINGRPWTDEKLVVHYRCYGPGGVNDFIDIEVPGIGRDNADKGSNKAMTQAYKYALIQALCIADAKDDADGDVAHQADAPAPDVGALPARPAQLTRIRELTGALRERGTEVTETNDEKEVWVVGIQLLERRDDGKLYATCTVADADNLIGTLNAKLADVLIAAAGEPPAVAAPAPADTDAGTGAAEPVQEATAPAERAMTDRERKARDQLDAVNPPKADKS